MSAYYEAMAAKAEKMVTPDIAIAAEPQLLFSDSRVCLKDTVSVDFDAIVETAVQKGKDPEDYSSLAIHIGGRDEFGANIHGVFQGWPQILQGQIHYPVIRLKAEPAPNQNRLNKFFRHEFYHSLQDLQGPPFYSKKWLQHLTRIGSVPLLGLGLFTKYEGVGDWIVHALELDIGLGMLICPQIMLWLADPNELTAKWYELTNTFAPFSVSSQDTNR